MALATYLRGSRGIPVHRDRLLICRGSQHGMQLAARLLFRRGGLLAAASLSYDPILAVAKDYGADILSIPLDEEGIDVESLAVHPKLSEVRAVYVTPHHQYPTTVTLSAERRLRLLDLAALHGFAIIEDDYDYDFHYGSGPQLPLAALDQRGSVIYLGSFSKILAPTLRVGYLLAPVEFINAALRQRLLTDRQGDLLLERALANYIVEGELDRHLRKVRKVYQLRRDHFHALLDQQLGQDIELRLPEGGMATWARVSPEIDFDQLRATCLGEGVWLSPSPPSWRAQGGLRLGFAALDEEEQQTAISVLSSALGMQATK